MNAPDAAAAVISALNALGVPHMVVGSLSVNVYGIVRATKDADLVIEAGHASIHQIASQLGKPFVLDPQMQFERITGTTKYNFSIEGSPLTVELFLLSNDEHDRERFRRRIRLPGSNPETCVPTVEDVLVMKLRWLHLANRSKDEGDIVTILQVRANEFDWPYVESWCDRHGTRATLDRVRRSARV